MRKIAELTKRPQETINAPQGASSGTPIRELIFDYSFPIDSIQFRPIFAGVDPLFARLFPSLLVLKRCAALRLQGGAKTSEIEPG